jgi:hypothetical protein
MESWGSNIIEWGAHLYILRPDEFGLGTGNLVANLAESNGEPHLLMAPGGTLLANRWQHVALTYDKETGQALLYRNGEIVAESNLGSFTPETSYDLYLGRRPAGDARLSYVGLLDEVTIYDRALTGLEIARIANAGNRGKCKQPAAFEPLVAFVHDGPEWMDKLALFASLEAIRTSFERGNLRAAIGQLQVFQEYVRSHIAPVDSALAAQLIQFTEELIAAADPTGERRRALAAMSNARMIVERGVCVAPGTFCVEASAIPGSACCVQRSANLRDWVTVGVADEWDDGLYEFIDAQLPRGPTCFYRLMAH